MLRALYFSNDFYNQLSQNLVLDSVRFSELFVRNEFLTGSLLSLHRSLEQIGSRLEFDSRMLSVRGHVSEHYAEAPSKNQSGASEHKKIRLAKEFLVENHIHVLSLDELSKVVGLSPYHLLRTLRSSIGLTPHDFVTLVRVERAKQLLCLGNAIADIAVGRGFVDQAHFTRRFKSIVGVTPGQYVQNRMPGLLSLKERCN